MKILLPLMFAALAALGNAMFALGQKKSVGVENGILFVSLSALLAALCALGVAALIFRPIPSAPETKFIGRMVDRENACL